jgi:hypothetical protein
MFSLVFILPNRALAQETGSNDKIDAISKKLEELEKQVDALKRENAELKTKFEQTQAPKLALAVDTKTPAAETRETTAAQEENKPQKTEKRIEFGGEIRLRPEARVNDLNNFTRDVDFLVRQRIRFDVKAKLSDDLSAFVQFQDSRLWGGEGATNSDFFNVDLHQAYIQADRILTDALSLRIGRQELSYGDERLVGAFDWNNVGRSFDAIKAVYAKKRWSADIFAARVNDEHDSGFFFRVGEDGSGFFSLPPHQEFYGAYLKFFNDSPNHKLEAYGFFLRDSRIATGEFGRIRRDSTGIYTVGTRQELKSDSGFYYDGEVAFQTGHRGPDGHKALALAARLGKYFKSARSPHFGFEYDFATGDGDSQDGRSREFINLFPNNHRHYGYMDFLGWRNMHDFRLGFGFNPVSRLSFDADYHKFLLHKGDGRWSNAEGITLGFDRTGSSGKDIGQEVDFTLGFPYKEHLKFITGYSLFVPGRFAKLRRSSDVSQFSYIQTMISF